MNMDEVSWKHGLSSAAFYKRRAKYIRINSMELMRFMELLVRKTQTYLSYMPFAVLLFQHLNYHKTA
ncbi:MAG: hypothetical protein ACI9SJ_002039 [Flavobacteriaceae bacterium]|jgi:hypothetical protein